MKLIIIFVAIFALSECRILKNEKLYPRCLKYSDSDRVDSGKQEVGVYIEALCPDCKDFVVNQLYPTFTKLSTANPPVMAVNLVTFGNANMTFLKNSSVNPSLKYTCQHGPQECEGNILQSCAVLKFPIEESLGLINCMFASPNWRTPWDSVSETPLSESTRGGDYYYMCSEKLKIDYNKLSECANSEDGIANVYFMAGQTLNLDPKHKYVPWVTINGQHTDEIQEKAETHLLRLVCDTYPISPKPDECKASLSESYEPNELSEFIF